MNIIRTYKNSKEIEELICIDELCKILKLKKSYIYLFTHEKKIPHYKLNGHLRFKLSDINEWLEKQYIVVQENVKIVDF